MRPMTKVIIGVTLFIIIICAGYCANLFNSSSGSSSSQVGEIEYKGQFLTPVENFKVVTSKYGERIHPITRKAKFSFRY